VNIKCCTFEHVKLQMTLLYKRSDPEGDNEEIMVRSKTRSRKVQRQLDKTMIEAPVADGRAAAALSSVGTTSSATEYKHLMETKMQATRFNQKFLLAKFCVEQDIEGGKEWIQIMMRKELKKETMEESMVRFESPAFALNSKKTGNENSTTQDELLSDSSSDGLDDTK
jgi:hypothetical protein